MFKDPQECLEQKEAEAEGQEREMKGREENLVYLVKVGSKERRESQEEEVILVCKDKKAKM